MAEYQKINTVFIRDKYNCIIPSIFTMSEFEEFNALGMKFEATEKIDGTNMRIELDFKMAENGSMECTHEYRGRTDRANIPGHLVNKMRELFDNVNWAEIFPDVDDDTHITIYGEGYGFKIQSGARYIGKEVNFIMFDVKVGNWWLSRKDVEDIAKKLNVDVVPLIGYMTIQEAINMVQEGFVSTIAEDKTYVAEGLVLKHPLGLRFRSGERICFKIKHEDFAKRDNKYGKGYTGVQEPNENYNNKYANR